MRSRTALLLLLLPLLVACGSATTSQPPAFRAVPLGLPAQALTSPVVGRLPDATLLHMRLALKLTSDGQRDKNTSRAFWLQVQDFFHGIRELRINPFGTSLSVDAPAGTLATILKTRFDLHRQPSGRVFYAPAQSPLLPVFLANRVVAIIGLDNYGEILRPDPTTQAGKQKTPLALLAGPANCSPVAQTVPPRTVASAYGLSQLWNAGLHGENTTVNLVEIDAFDQNDLANYLTCIGFQGPQPRVVTVDGAPTQAVGEATLDLEMAAGLARSVNLIDYQTNGNTQLDIWVQIYDILQRIISDHSGGNGSAGNVVSISFGAAESQVPMQDRIAIDQSLQTLVQTERIPVLVSSGDYGAYTNRTSLSVSFPASDPWAIAVGGTILTTDAAGNRLNEVVWPGDGGQYLGSGGGNSAVFPRPAWQVASGIPSGQSTGGRQIPDVAAVASNLAFFFQGRWIVAGGTSTAAPIWAAGTVLVNEGLLLQAHTPLFSPQQLYTLASTPRHTGSVPFYDVVSGNNHTFSATPGWDYVTGLGTPNFPQIYQLLLAS